MSARTVRWSGRTIGLIWVALIAFLIGSVVFVHFAPQLGLELFSVRGSSMEPSIPLGSVVAVHQLEPSAVQVGDIVSVRNPTGGTVTTHRVVRVANLGDAGLAFELRGDANREPDAVLVPASTLIGRVDFYVPFLGYLLSMISTPSGLIAWVAFLGAMLLAILWFDSLADGLEAGRRRSGPALAGPMAAGPMAAGPMPAGPVPAVSATTAWPSEDLSSAEVPPRR